MIKRTGLDRPVDRPNGPDDPDRSRVPKRLRPLGPAPLVAPAVALMLGILLDSVCAGRPWAYAVCCGVGLLLVLVPSRRRRWGMVSVVLVAGSTGGLLHHNAYRRVATDHIVHHVPFDGTGLARVRGTVLTAPRITPRATGPFAPWMYSPDRTSFLLEADAVERDARFVSASGRVRVTVKEAVMDLAVGERVELFGLLYRPGPPENPGQFDWSRWQRRHGVLVGMSCNYQEAITKLEPGPSGCWSGRLDRVRQRLRGLVLDEMLATGGPETSLLDAMVLARRSTIDPSINEAFIRIGCAHYLAVSGLHLGILGLFVFTVGRLLGLAIRPCSVMVVVVTVCYAVLAEPRPPILRATILAVAVCTSLLVGRRGQAFNWLALAAILNLIWRPTDLFDAGFQMSYVCVAGLIGLQPALADLATAALASLGRRGGVVTNLDDAGRPGSRRPFRPILGAVLLSPSAMFVAACVPSWPIILLHFQRFSPWAWMNTLIICIPAALVMCLGFAGLLVALVSPWLAGTLTPLLKGAAFVLLSLVALLGRVPGTTMYATSGPPAIWMACYYAGLLAWVGVHRGLLRRRWAVVVSAVCLAGTVVWLMPSRPTGQLTMTVLSVGRGTSIVIELPDGGAVLYDAGCSGSYDVGKTAIVPFLAHCGVGRVAAAVVSHPNIDHFGGLLSVADRVRLDRVMVNPQFEGLSPSNKPSSVLLEELNRRGLPVETIDSSAGGFEIGGASFEVLWPPAELPFEPTANESSIVLRVSHAGHSILLTGDIEEEAQRRLLGLGVDLSADVLVLPHHGSARWNTPAFVEAVSPTTVIRSTSQRAGPSPGSPQPAPGDRPMFNTADDGAVEVVVTQRGIEVHGFLSGAEPTATSR